MKNYSTLLLSLFSILLLVSCSKEESTPTPTTISIPNNNFEKTFGGPQDDIANSIIIENGELYIFGTTKSLGDVNGDHYLIKTDLDGNVLFEKNFGGASLEDGVKIITTNDGNFILIGTTESLGAGQKDIHVIKIDNQGNQLWENTFGGTLNDTPADIIELSNSEFCIAGTTESFGAGSRDIYLVWIDQNGNFIRETTHGGANIDGSAELLEISNQEIMVYGYTMNFGATSRDLYLYKTNFLGDSLWSQRYGGAGYEESQAFAQTQNGDYILCGHSSSTDPNHNIYGVKIDVNGNQVWDVNFGGSQHDGGEALLINSDGNYVFIGRTMSSGAGMRDAMMVVCDPNGQTNSTKYFGDTQDDRIDDIVEYGGYYYLVGQSNSFSNGDNDVYLIKHHK